MQTELHGNMDDNVLEELVFSVLLTGADPLSVCFLWAIKSLIITRFSKMSNSAIHHFNQIA